MGPKNKNLSDKAQKSNLGFDIGSFTPSYKLRMRKL